MEDLDAFQLTAAAVYAVFAFIYGAFVRRAFRDGWWIFGRTAGLLIPLVGAAVSVRFTTFAVMSLVPASLWSWSAVPGWLCAICVVAEWTMVWAAAASPHVWRLMAGGDRPPGRAWLVANYTPAVLLSAGPSLLLLPAARSEHLLSYITLRLVVTVLWLALAAYELGKTHHPSSWQPGFAGARAGRRDFAVVTSVVLLFVIVVPAIVWVRPSPHTVFVSDKRWLFLVLETVVTLLLLLPWAARTRGAHARSIAVAGGVVLAVCAALLAAQAAVEPLLDAGLVRLGGVVALAAVLAMVTLCRSAVESAIDRLLLRKRIRGWERLETVVRTLPAEEGVLPCAQRLAEALVAERLFEGAAVLLEGGVVVTAGRIEAAPLEALWRREGGSPAPHAAAAGPPPGEPAILPQPGTDLAEPVLAAFAAAGVISLVPAADTRWHWGYLCFGLVKPLTHFVADESERALKTGAELALVLDGAALVERTVAVERSLAHTEKLAAVGETAARIAHEIRSPVTAARSLAQMLVRNPTSPRSAEQAQLILGELERVERQVSALLGFARREEFRFEPVALDDLVRATLAGLGPRLSEAGVAVELDLDGKVVARGDREKIRQVLMNLIQNAVDAMSDHASPRQLNVAVTRTNGTASLVVSDTGGGIPLELRPHVFEPFRSGKPQGTGLGLAIAKQTIDAHGGRIAVVPSPERGTRVTVELPLLEQAT